MAQEQQKEVFKFCKKLMKKGYTEIPIEEISTFQRLTAEDFFWYVKEVFGSNLPFEEKNEALEQILISKGVPEKWLYMYSSPSTHESPSFYLLYDGDDKERKAHYIILFREDYFQYFEVPYVQECYFKFIREIQEFYLKTGIEYQRWLRERSMGKQKSMRVSKGNQNGKGQ